MGTPNKSGTPADDIFYITNPGRYIFRDNSYSKKPGEYDYKSFFTSVDGNEIRPNHLEKKHLDIYILCGDTNVVGAGNVLDVPSQAARLAPIEFTSWWNNRKPNSGIHQDRLARTTKLFNAAPWAKLRIRHSSHRYTQALNQKQSDYFGPEYGFALKMDSLTDSKIGILKYTVEESKSKLWTGKGYGDALTKLKQAIQSSMNSLTSFTGKVGPGKKYDTYSINGIIFWQGQYGDEEDDIRNFISNISWWIHSRYETPYSNAQDIPFVLTKNSYAGWGEGYENIAKDYPKRISIIDLADYGSQIQYKISNFNYANNSGSGDHSVRKDFAVSGKNDLLTIGFDLAKKIYNASGGEGNIWTPKAIFDSVSYSTENSSKTVNELDVGDKIEMIGSNQLLVGDYGNTVSSSPTNGEMLLKDRAEIWKKTTNDIFVKPIGFPTPTEDSNQYTDFTTSLSKSNFRTTWRDSHTSNEPSVLAWLNCSEEKDCFLDDSKNVKHIKNPGKFLDQGPSSSANLKYLNNLNNGNGGVAFTNGNPYYSLRSNSISGGFKYRFFLVFNPREIQDEKDILLQISQNYGITDWEFYDIVPGQSTTTDKFGEFEGRVYKTDKTSESTTSSYIDADDTSINLKYFSEPLRKRWRLMEILIEYKPTDSEIDIHFIDPSYSSDGSTSSGKSATNISTNWSDNGVIDINLMGGTTDSGNKSVGGYLGEFLLLDENSASAEEKNSIRKYLNSKWNLDDLKIYPKPLLDNNGVVFYSQDSSAWSPREISTNNLWLDASDEKTIISRGDNVLQWLDKSANKYHGSSESSKRPKINQNTLNSLNVITLSQSFIKNENNNETNWQDVYIIARYTGGTTGFENYDGLFTGPGTATDNNQIGIVGTKDQGVLFTGLKWWDSLYLNGHATSSNSNVYSTMSSYCIISISRNTNLATQSDSNGDIPHGWLIGQDRNAVGRDWVGDIAEVLCFSEKLENSDRLKVEGYLAHKWGLQGDLPADHTYKSSAPTSSFFFNG
jgi:hypothetical protein